MRTTWIPCRYYVSALYGMTSRRPLMTYKVHFSYFQRIKNHPFRSRDDWVRNPHVSHWHTLARGLPGPLRPLDGYHRSPKGPPLWPPWPSPTSRGATPASLALFDLQKAHTDLQRALTDLQRAYSGLSGPLRPPRGLSRTLREPTLGQWPPWPSPTSRWLSH